MLNLCTYVEEDVTKYVVIYLNDFQVQICGEDIQSSMSAVFEMMGYCPQHDALWSNVTVAEHITGYAEIRGIRKDQVKLYDILSYLLCPCYFQITAKNLELLTIIICEYI